MSDGDGGDGANDPPLDLRALPATLRRLKRHYIFISVCAGLAVLIAIIQLIAAN